MHSGYFTTLFLGCQNRSASHTRKDGFMKPTQPVFADSPGPRRPVPAPASDPTLQEEMLAVLDIACRLQSRQRSAAGRLSGANRFRRWGGQ